MPRTKSYARDALVEGVRDLFWSHGYYATSIDDLVQTTGVSRHGLYAEFGGKRGAFLAAVESYFDDVVTPAFGRVESDGAGLAEIADYFEHQIALAESVGLPGPGCLVGNTTVESGPHDAAFGDLVAIHLARLTDGFTKAIRAEVERRGTTPSPSVPEIARYLTISSQGLWSVSRVSSSSAPLRRFVKTLLASVERMVAP